MPDTVLPPSDHQLVRRHRVVLPRHDLPQGNVRRWAAAVCQAEVDHRSSDFDSAARKAGLYFDRFANPNVVMIGSFAHEARAGEALNWLSHLQFMDGQRHGVWQHWSIWSREEKVAWARKRRTVVRGFLRAVAAYRAARAEVDMEAMRRAA